MDVHVAFDHIVELVPRAQHEFEAGETVKPDSRCQHSARRVKTG